MRKLNARIALLESKNSELTSRLALAKTFNERHRAESGVGQRAPLPSVVDIEPRETKSGMLVFDISAAIDDRKLGKSYSMARNTIQLRLKDTVGCEFWVHPERFKVDEGVHEATTQAEFEGSFEKRFEG